MDAFYRSFVTMQIIYYVALHYDTHVKQQQYDLHLL
jgi:hypothetical protein